MYPLKMKVAGVVRRESGKAIANRSVRQYAEITPENLASFFTVQGFVVAAVIVVGSSAPISIALEVAPVLVMGLALAGGLALATSLYGREVIRTAFT